MTRPHYHYHYNYAFAIATVLLSFNYLHFAQCQLPNEDKLMNEIYGLTSTVLTAQYAKDAKFCIKDLNGEWDQTFNYTSNLTFVRSCIQKTNGDMSLRLCSTAEAMFYFHSLIGGGSRILANKNCNTTSWVPGCEPGWACRVDGTVSLNNSQDIPHNNTKDIPRNNTKDIPYRTLDCMACCEGFFCPEGLTCMIPCPLGSYCPLATLNLITGLCDPYSYPLPPGQSNHTCGTANIWTDVAHSREVFCSGGSYCPTTTEKDSCSSGNYCRMGSTYEKRCIKFASCHAKAVYQNIHLYGVMLIVTLVTILLIIYTCLDLVISIRKKRHAKSRKVATRSVRQKTQARERSKSAKNDAMKHVRDFQNQLSGTFCHRKTVTLAEDLKNFDQPDIEIVDDLCPTTHACILSASKQSHAVTGGKRIIEPSTELMMVIHATEEDPDKAIEIEDEYMQRSRHIEREKAMGQQNLTFSGAISMATKLEMKKRPTIEVSFRYLTLTLKRTNKHILRCMTGKIMPSRITAVMGPSGAGKTTFLSALVGKTVGYRMTGSILINGKNESIRSYKKIIGFVPQDDIVHGNLTVEENMWFSASCRLSANLRKADKVLIVERVIEELGLQEVRDSLVGTVENRGISGGQRKRVNVGLELVMEPSLLLLDEPTSGLDSSSSQLLLRALRREALGGVNICMVVHQPSYSLFKMFDDLILLAKGGLTVYHGPVERVKEYFASLGINVPEHVNPPDYFIDLLEDVVKLSTSSGISSRELPIQWMLYNGYLVPSDMQKISPRLAIHSARATLYDQVYFNATFEELSFATQVWQDIRSNVEIQQDIIRHNFLQSKDLSNRRTPNFYLQYKYFLGRVVKQRLREARLLAVDFLILLLAGAGIGSLIQFDDEKFGLNIYVFAIIAISLLCTISALRSFSQDKLQYWRESASGISSLAHFLSKDTIDHLNTVIKPAVFLSMFYSFTNPRSSFLDNYVVLICLVYCVTGIGYALSIFLEPGPSQLCAVLLPVILTLISTQTGDGKLVKKLANLCYPKWALEALVVANAERYSGVWVITRCGLLHKMGYSLSGWGHCLSFLILTGVVTRAIAYVGMLTIKRKH